MASRDFTIDTLDGRFILIPHTQAAKEMLSELALEENTIEGYVVPDDDVIDLAYRLRREGFAINS